MLWFLLVVVLIAIVAFVLHYGYKLAFYYEDPHNSPHEGPDNDQTRACKETFDAAISEFEEAPFERVSIVSHDGLTLSGCYYHNADKAPLQIQCHGYKGNAIRDFCGSWKVAKALGHNVLLIDQRCHGQSQGHTITFGIQERKDVLRWIQYANERFGTVPILLSGVSMGAATVLMASGLQLPDNVKAVFADCPFDAPANIIQKVLGQDMGMPVPIVYPLIRFGGMVYGRFNLNADSATAAVTKSKVPILLIHGDDDRFVPYEMSCRIHAAAPEKVEFHTIPGAGHALNFAMAPERYQQILLEFIQKWM